MTGFCEHGNELYGSMKAGEFLGMLNNYQRSMKGNNVLSVKTQLKKLSLIIDIDYAFKCLIIQSPCYRHDDRLLQRVSVFLRR